MNVASRAQSTSSPAISAVSSPRGARPVSLSRYVKSASSVRAITSLALRPEHPGDGIDRLMHTFQEASRLPLTPGGLPALLESPRPPDRRGENLAIHSGGA